MVAPVLILRHGDGIEAFEAEVDAAGGGIGRGPHHDVFGHVALEAAGDLEEIDQLRRVFKPALGLCREVSGRWLAHRHQLTDEGAGSVFAFEQRGLAVAGQAAAGERGGGRDGSERGKGGEGLQHGAVSFERRLPERAELGQSSR